MKKDVAASAAEAVAPKKPEFALIDEDLLKSRIYTIRGVKVMLDADLAEIYGYSTKDFNRQVKNNIERFAEDFRFQLTKREVEELRSKKFTAITDANDAKDLRCKNCTANISTMSRSNPFVFTEQGIYMLMTVLKGDLAVQQSMALIRLFKQMKDYIAAENAPDVSAGMVALATQTSQNTRDIAEIATDVRTLSNKVERNESFLQKVMSNFIDPSTFKHFLILNGQKLDADVAYTQIYGMAKKSITIIDDYVGVKTLDLLRGIAKGISVTIYSDENGYESLTEQIQKDFLKARPDIKFDNKKTKEKFHDRYIFLDYGLKGEKLFHCGASSKDAGNKITTIMQIENTEIYHVLMEKLSVNPRL